MIVSLFLTFKSKLRFTDLVEDICRHSSPSIYELAAYLIARHGSLANVLQEQIVENTSLLEIDVLLETLDRIEMVAIIDEKILASIQKLHLCDLTTLLNSDDYFCWTKKSGKWIEKIVSQLGRILFYYRLL